MSPKLLIGLLVVLVVFVGVNALLAQQKPKLTVVPGGAQNTPGGRGQSGLGATGYAGGGLG